MDLYLNHQFTMKKNKWESYRIFDRWRLKKTWKTVVSLEILYLVIYPTKKTNHDPFSVISDRDIGPHYTSCLVYGAFRYLVWCALIRTYQSFTNREVFHGFLDFICIAPCVSTLVNEFSLLSSEHILLPLKKQNQGSCAGENCRWSLLCLL